MVQTKDKNIIWINRNGILNHNLNKTKPCYILFYCPYGSLVKEFPLKDKSKFSCKTFGHDCPMYYQAEDITEDEEKS